MTRQDAITAAAKAEYEQETGLRWAELADHLQRLRRNRITPLIEAAAPILEADGARRVENAHPYPQRKDGQIVVKCAAWDCDSELVHDCLVAPRCPDHCSIPKRHYAHLVTLDVVVPPPGMKARIISSDVWDKLPSGPRRAAQTAVAAGWRVQVTDAYGPWTSTSGELLQERVWSLLVKAEKMSDRAAMLWLRRGETWKLEGSWWGIERTAIKEVLRRMGDQDE